MALQGTITTGDGVEHTAAYARVEEVNQNKKRAGGHITVTIYHNEDSKDNGMLPIDQRAFDLPYTVSEATEEEEAVIVSFESVLGLDVINPDGENDYKSVYENLLKLTPEFKDWEDV